MLEPLDSSYIHGWMDFHPVRGVRRGAGGQLAHWLPMTVPVLLSGSRGARLSGSSLP